MKKTLTFLALSLTTSLAFSQPSLKNPYDTSMLNQSAQQQRHQFIDSFIKAYNKLGSLTEGAAKYLAPNYHLTMNGILISKNLTNTKHYDNKLHTTRSRIAIDLPYRSLLDTETQAVIQYNSTITLKSGKVRHGLAYAILTFSNDGKISDWNAVTVKVKP